MTIRGSVSGAVFEITRVAFLFFFCVFGRPFVVVVVGGGGWWWWWCIGQRPGQVSFISLRVRGSLKLELVNFTWIVTMDEDNIDRYRARIAT